jgi:hypothetical protein
MPLDLSEKKTEADRKLPWKGNAKRRLKFWTNVSLVVAIVAGIGVAIAHGGNITSATAWCGASLGGGAALGFLFGIPGRSNRRVIINQPGVAAVGTGINAAGTGVVGTVTTATSAGGKANTPQPDPGAGGVSSAGGFGVSSSPPNQSDSDSVIAGAGGLATPPAATSGAIGASSSQALVQPDSDPAPDESNLVQVSDWVTKLLLGGGLTQLQRIPPKIWELSGWVAIGIDPTVAVPGKEASLQSNQAFAAGLLIYFFILGFFGGYLVTQLQLRRRLQS